MFPYDIDDTEEETEEIEKEDSEPKEYEIDFKTGQLTGKVVTGLEAIKTWAWLALHTERYRYLQYSWDYGNELETLIEEHSCNQEYINAEAERLITECLSTNEYITGIEDVECDVIDDNVRLRFRIITDYGEGDIDV
ncbi:DUF2634 domain-containing protein [Velocimicrobium porci]|uniref:DUF2634 domain-containing protein n=1 Tax=Velocimicrobium porci TaxID=2606634 RepID=A0A6L5XXB5_9FIRM|nr:DUF2634 domain-containing protein [Velocimicrobium porci]MSS63187.1 DUF2634 domain-containing protein [Velocimicrobium porci]